MKKYMITKMKKNNRLFFIIFFFLFPFFSFSQQTMHCYFGNLHSHTSYSDGMGTPRRAFIYARDTAKIDFLAVTDHLEALDTSEWDSIKFMADEVTQDSVFIGIAGYEWTSDTLGHCNVFNTPDMVSTSNLNNWSAFVQSVLNESPAIVQFNHPGYPFTSNKWNSFTNMGTSADSAFALIEIIIYLEEYFYMEALDSNWHVSPSNNQDNHNADWGTKNEGRTGIWATGLTRQNLFDAIKAGRTFSTMDKNSSVWLDINGTPMGSEISYASNMPLHIMLNDADSEQWNNIQLIGANGHIFMNLTNHAAFLDTIVYITPSASKWLYLKAKQYDDQYIFSAPFYITNLPIGINDYKEQYDHLLSVYPNPLNTSSAVIFQLMEAANITLKIMDISGRQLAILCDQRLPKGKHKFLIPVKNLTHGVYLMEYNDGTVCKTIKIIY